jgi:hypothetical protein
MSSMPSTLLQNAGPRRVPKLQLLPREESTRREAGQAPRCAAVHSGHARRPVLIAAGSESDRRQMLRDFSASMPASTVFEETGQIAEVLERAPRSSVVILGGELEQLPAPSVMRMLGHRHPDVPVVCLDSLQTTDFA